ncbi:MAG: hypothetical protein QOG71_1808 [Pyrinomonadaceae bacterium]|nr:hypothetical protein [Pyrinomonadaceae bacterium]
MVKRYNVLGGAAAGALLVMVLYVFTNVGKASSICLTAACRVTADPIVDANYQSCGFSIYKEETRLIKFSDNSQQYELTRGTGACVYVDYTLTTECWPQFQTPMYKESNFGAYGDAEWSQTVINQRNGILSACSAGESETFVVTHSCSGEQNEDGPEVE